MIYTQQAIHIIFVKCHIPMLTFIPFKFMFSFQ